jgi:transglycosylase-like protein with SLT domain
MMAWFGITAPSCRQAIAAAERANGLPAGLLGAIARVESGRRDLDTGTMEPWPWTADVEGTGAFYESKEAALAAVRRAQAQGIRSIDVGCMQVNLQQHPEAFPSLEAAFDPATNVAYAVRFLQGLHEQTGDWAKAAAMYHSATPSIGAEYERKVLAAWPDEQRIPVARAWAAADSACQGGCTAFSAVP